MQKTSYVLTTAKSGVSFKAAVVADLHDRTYAGVLPLLEQERPDMILVPGDVTEALNGVP